MARQLIDDSDSAVEYNPPWHPDPGAYMMVDRSRHGATNSGDTATLLFTGTGIEVLGFVGPSSVNGYPTTTYAIDGNQVGSYTPSFVPAGNPLYNVSFFARHGLPHTTHTLVITNVNGTSPNCYWLDYFLVDVSTNPQPSTPTPSPVSQPPDTTPSSKTDSPTISSTASTSSSTRNSTSLSTASRTSMSSDTFTSSTTNLHTVSTVPEGNTSSIAPMPFVATSTHPLSSVSITSSSETSIPTMTTTTSHALTSIHLLIAVILGSVFGGFIFALTIAYVCFRKRRKQTKHEVVPFTYPPSSVTREARSHIVSLSSDPYGHMPKSEDILSSPELLVPSRALQISSPSKSGRLLLTPPLSFADSPRPAPTPTRAWSLSTSMRSDILSTQIGSLLSAPARDRRSRARVEVGAGTGRAGDEGVAATTPSRSWLGLNRSSSISSSGPRLAGRAFVQEKLFEAIYGDGRRDSPAGPTGRARE